MVDTILDPRITARIGDACGRAASIARSRVDHAVQKEANGQAATREDTLTDDLTDAIDAVGEGLKRHLNELGNVFVERKKDIRIEFTTEKAPQGEENDFGLDLGVRLVVETPEYAVDKAILVQCKRMYGAGTASTFPKLRGDGEQQAAAMLAVSPSSFFFLFNGGPPHEILKQMLTMPLAVATCEQCFSHISHREPYFDPGVAVLPASRVFGMSRAAKLAGTKFPEGAKDVLAGSVPLGHFVASLLSSCFVGDVRKPVIQLATPPANRESVIGLDAKVPELGELKARRFYKLKISAKETDRRKQKTRHK